MKITYDKSADAAYIYLTQLAPGSVKNTYHCSMSEVDGMINLDFDAESTLVGIEVLEAKTKLPSDLLTHAEIIG